jgi:hypothetical protein
MYLLLREYYSCVKSIILRNAKLRTEQAGTPETEFRQGNLSDAELRSSRNLLV